MWAPRWSPWQELARWSRASHERAVANARSAATELSRRLVERREVELFLREHGAVSPSRTSSRPA